MEVQKAEIQKIKYDGSVAIATGSSAKTKIWKNKTIKWSDLLDKLSQTTRTPETVAEYKKLSKAEKGRIKDVGGFVGGSLKEGRRLKANVQCRSLLTLDLDYVKDDIWEEITVIYGFCVCMYSTHTHTPDNPRLRLIIPLSRPVLPDEYQCIGRTIADDLGIDQFDDTTYDPERLMFWPSTPSDGEFVFKYQDLEWLNPDEILGRYKFGWQDVSYWPESSRARARLNKALSKQEDPLTKKGIIGAFCRTYTITDVIDEFLSDVYVPGKDDTRYTYAEGSTTGGVVIYDDKFSYSHHGTDPASNILCNSFDLVRIHKFGELDVDSEAKGSKLPSFKAMEEFAAKDSKVIAQIGKDRLEDANEEFEVVEDEENWMSKLIINDNGTLKSTSDNFLLIISNDPNLKGKMGYNEFSNRICVLGQLPWRKKGDFSDWCDSDDSSLRIYISRVWRISSKQNCDDALNETIKRNSYHPVRDYLNGLKWDGIKRVDTVLVDYMGAEDTEYTRIVTRKWMCGAVARILHPGIKFDYMLVLTGKQGLYKSTFLATLAKNKWFTDSIQDVEGNQAIEKLMNSWIVEFGELQAFSKSESNAIKRFITSQEDRTRLAYARRSTYLKRQCVFAGTTNKNEFLKDETGNRRFWPIEVKEEGRVKDVIKDLPNEIDQIWAEAIHLWKDEKETLYLTKEQEELAFYEQEEHREISEKEGIILEYLDKLLPEGWDDMDIYKRRNYINGDDLLKGTVKRDKVCVLEVWCECFGKDKADMKRTDSFEISNILSNIKILEKAKNSIRFKIYGKQKYFKVKA